MRRILPRRLDHRCRAGRTPGRRALRCRRALRQLLAGGVLSLLTAGLAATGLVAPAAAQEPDRATLTGIDLAEPLEITPEGQPGRYADLEREVGWLIGRRGDSPEPEADSLGPQYTLLWYRQDRGHRFHLYPLAQGGPRVFRPAEQPDDRTVREAWYFARLSLPETLQEWGVPLTGDPALAGGSGGGQQDEGSASARGPLGFLDQWREGMLLTAGLTVALLAGLASVAYLVRR